MSAEKSPPKTEEHSGSGSKAFPRKGKVWPWLGIASVLIGLSISVLTGQLLSIGLADLRGAMHLSVDQGAWLAATFNAGQMFIGPMTVYVGGLIGPRRVLLISAPVVAIAMLLSPFATYYPALLCLLACAGLGCGSFYPLTLSFIARNLPRPYILFGVAAYAVDAIGSLHVASLLEGLYMQYLSWHWILWTAAALAPLMWVLVYFGVPGTPTAPVDTKKLRPTWAGFVYTSFAFTCFFLLLTQGERLDWLRSGVIVGLFFSGVFLLAAALIRHFTRPNPLVDLSFLVRRNILLLSLSLCTLRFSLLSSAELAPQFLSSVQGYIPLQTGVLLGWVALPAFVFALCGALSMKLFDPRLVLTFGFGLLAAVCLRNIGISSAWARQNLFAGEMLIGVGSAVAVCGLIGCIVLEVVNSGAVKNPIRTLTFVAWFHTVRLLGGEIVTSLMTHLLTIRGKFHAQALGQYLNAGRFAVTQQMQSLTQILLPKSSGEPTALARAGGVIAKRLQVQATTLSIMDAYAIEAVVLTLCLFVVAFIAREPLQFRDLLKAQK